MTDEWRRIDTCLEAIDLVGAHEYMRELLGVLEIEQTDGEALLLKPRI